jgi:hypothetical protein
LSASLDGGPVRVVFAVGQSTWYLQGGALLLPFRLEGTSLSVEPDQKPWSVGLIVFWALSLVVVFLAYIFDGLEMMIMALAFVAIAGIIAERLGALGKK